MKYFLILTFFIITSCKPYHNLKEGDLLFQDLDNSELSEAIENATSYSNDFKISHMGILIKENHKLYVIEAYDSVQKTPLHIFLNRSKDHKNKPKVRVGRLKKQYTPFITRSIANAKKRIGLPYDKQFMLNNNAYYCSELIYDCFLDNNNTPLFTVYPMSFTNKKTGEIDPIWIDYFNAQNIATPQGELGCNPSDYFKSDKIKSIQIRF